MRDACHQNLYSIANSAGMNGMGPETTVKLKDIAIVSSFRTGAVVVSALFILCLVMWIVKKRKFKKTEDYTSYQAYRAANNGK